MTIEEYKNKIKAINAEYKLKIAYIQKEYAESNSSIKVGDFITDHYHTIKVESWHVSFAGFSEYPCLVYHGSQYTKSNNVAKKQTDTQMWQNNIKFVNGKAIKK